MTSTSASYPERVLFARLSRILRDINVIGANVPADEYDPEADAIVEALRAEAAPPDEAVVGRICHDVFERWFDRETAAELARDPELVTRVLEAWHAYSRRTR